MEKKYVLGVDISKKKLDVCLLREKEVLLQKCIPNTIKDILWFLQRLKEEYPIEFSSLLICAEHTGMYSYPLINAAESMGSNLWMEDPAQIKYSSGISKGKNDKADARKIALYGYRFKDKQKRYTSLDNEIAELKLLQSERTILIGDKAKYKGQINDQDGFMQNQIFLAKKKRLLSIIDAYQKAIKEIDLQINQIISNNKLIQRQFTLLKTVEGVGDKVALKRHCP